MSVGNFGNIRPSDVNINDIDIFYNFTPNRETESTEFFRINTTEVLSELEVPVDEQISGRENILEGMYDLKLPATIFNQTGFYNIYIKPKTINLEITDCGVLSALPTVKGIIIDANDLDVELTENNALQGYRIEYINDDGTKLRNVVRYVVTSNKVIPVTENVGNTSQRTVRYRFDDSGSLIFLQVTPSSSSSLKPNELPFIGVAGQNIKMSNTFFNPILLEVEMVENTIDSVIDYVAGEQIKDVDNGIFTNYDGDRNILRQFDLYEIKDDTSNTSLYEVKERRENIDNSQDFNEVTDSIESQ